MPELPEVETIRRDLEKEVVGKKIKAVEVHGARSTRRHKTKKPFIARLEGQKIESVSRRGKNLLLSLGDDLLVIHLGMSGQLLRNQTRDKVVPHTHVLITFTQGGQLRFVDPRTFGELYVVAGDQLAAEAPDLVELGYDPMESLLSWERFGAMLRARSVQLKSLLMDQKFVAGIGNMYADEILWEAGLRYDRLSDSLSVQEVRRLYRAIVEVLQDAIKHRGSTLADEQYVDLFGRPGSYQFEHKVYAHEGEACRRCRHPIMRVKFAGRSTYFCGSCQV